MDTKVILGATIAGAAGYFGAKMGAGLDDASSMGAGLGLAMLAGGALHMTGSKSTGVSDEQKNWEKELAEGA
jgi:predicted phage tail protein